MNWLAFYNKEGVGDVLLLTNQNSEGLEVISESFGPITLIKNVENNNLLSVNLFGYALELGLEGNGPIELTNEQVEKINDILKEQKLDITIEVDNTPKFVVGYVEKCVAHPDSDHLHITQTKVSDHETLQIVCGASNIAQGQKVLVAKPGAVMPNGLIIWPGSLRGEESHGMICSTRELNLTRIEDYPGIWVLKDEFEVGTDLETVVKTY